MNNFKITQSQSNSQANQFLLTARLQNSNNIQSVIDRQRGSNIKLTRSKMVDKKRQMTKIQKSVQDNPEYFRIDNQISHKLYEIYRRLKIGPSRQNNKLSFSETDQRNQTMNYNKIIEIFKDLNTNLEINQKLQILRAIKKFCFNQNFINEQQFNKIFKVIVHGLAFKQSMFKPLIESKYQTANQRDGSNFKRKDLSIKINKNFVKKLRTEPEMQNIKQQYQLNHLKQRNKTLQTILRNDNTIVKNQGTPTFNKQNNLSPPTKAQNRKRLLTDPTYYESPVRSYLSRAIQKNKLGKITWQNLFKMTEDNMHPSISIPSFVNKETFDSVYF